MATTTGIRLTRAGEALLSKIHAGNDKLKLTTFVIGDAVWTEQEIEDCKVTALKNERVRANVSHISHGTGEQAGRVIVDGLFSNHTIDEWFYVREIGIMALDTEGNEILYAVDPIPENAPTTVIEGAEIRQDIPIRMELIAVTRDQVELTLTDSLDLVTKEYLWNVVDEIYSKIADEDTDMEAAKAKKLATPRDIGLEGGVTGTPTAFDGSEDISIPVTAINADFINCGTLKAQYLPGSIHADTTGNAATATRAATADALTTARCIGLSGAATGTATSFNGAANITIPVTSVNGACVTGTVANATNATVATCANQLTTARTIGISGGATGTATSFNGSGNITIPVTAINGACVTGTVANATNAVCATNATTAGTANQLTTARTIGISGGATGTATSFNGTGNITIPVTSVAGACVTGTVPNATNAVCATNATTAGTAVQLTNARTVHVNLASTAAASFNGTANVAPGVTGVLPVANGGTGNTTGAITCATQLSTARTIGISGGATGTATSFNGTANIAIPVTALNATCLTTGTVPVGRLGYTTSLATNGYTKFPNGLIIQWGEASRGTSDVTTIYFPTSFTASAYSISLTIRGEAPGSSSNSNVRVHSKTTSSFQFYAEYGEPTVFFMAIGR